MNSLDSHSSTAGESMLAALHEGTPCGPAFMEALSKACGIALDDDVYRQSIMFTEGGGVAERCAAFQSAVAIIGIFLGRTEASGDRQNTRAASHYLAQAMKERFGSYYCCGSELCDDNKKIQLARYVAEVLDSIIIEGAFMKSRFEKFKVHPRLENYASFIMTDQDWHVVDSAQDDGTLDMRCFSAEECDAMYRRGVMDKVITKEGETYKLGTFHKRIDCFLRGETDAFNSLPSDVREAIVEYEQDIDIWIFPFRKEGVNQKAVHAMPLEVAQQTIHNMDTRFYTQECDCKIYRKGAHGLHETCIHFFTDESLPNSNLDRGYGKEITKEEAEDLLRRADEEGLVHNFDGHGFCNCCGCCCWAVRGIKDYRAAGFDVFGEYVYAKYLIDVNSDSCKACGACVKVCPVEALSLSDDAVVVNPDLCIGCGVCRAKCHFDALSIIKRGDA